MKYDVADPRKQIFNHFTVQIQLNLGIDQFLSRHWSIMPIEQTCKPYKEDSSKIKSHDLDGNFTSLPRDITIPLNLHQTAILCKCITTCRTSYIDVVPYTTILLVYMSIDSKMQIVHDVDFSVKVEALFQTTQRSANERTTLSMIINFELLGQLDLVWAQVQVLS